MVGTVRPPAGLGSLDFGPISSLVLLAPTPEEEPNASGLSEAQVCLSTLVSRPFGPTSRGPPNANG